MFHNIFKYQYKDQLQFPRFVAAARLNLQRLDFEFHISRNL